MLAAKCAPNNDEGNEMLDKVLGSIGLDMNTVLDDARDRKAKELVQQYAQHEPDAVTEIQELLADAGVSMDTFMAKALAKGPAFHASFRWRSSSIGPLPPQILATPDCVDRSSSNEIRFLAERNPAVVDKPRMRRPLPETQRDRSIDLTQGSGVLSGNWWAPFHAHWTEANRAGFDAARVRACPAHRPCPPHRRFLAHLRRRHSTVIGDVATMGIQDPACSMPDRYACWAS